MSKPPPSSSDRSGLVLALILLSATLLRILFFHGIFASDQFTYCSGAWDLANGHWNPAAFYEQTSRWGIILPLAIGFNVLGVNDFSSTIWSLLTSLGTIWVGYLLGRLLNGERAGLFGAALIAVFPLEIVFATQPMADGPLSFWLLLSHYLLLKAESGVGHERARFLLCGIALGIAYGTKIVALLIAPFFLVYFLTRQRVNRRWVWILLGFLAVFGLEYLLFRYFYGNGLLRLQLARTDLGNDVFEVSGGMTLPTASWLYLYWMLVDIRYGGLSFIALIVMSATRLREMVSARYPLLWSGALLAILSFYPMSFRPYVPLVKIPAYLLMFSAPLLVVLGIHFANSKRGAQLLVLLVVSSLPLAYVAQTGYRAEPENARAIFAFAQANPDRAIYAHRGDVRYLQYFSGFREVQHYRSFRLARPQDLEPGEQITFEHCFVAINHAMIRRHTEDRYPAEVLDPPSSWREVGRYQRPATLVESGVMGAATTLRKRGLITGQSFDRFRLSVERWVQRDPTVIYQVD